MSSTCSQDVSKFVASKDLMNQNENCNRRAWILMPLFFHTIFENAADEFIQHFCNFSVW